MISKVMKLAVLAGVMVGAMGCDKPSGGAPAVSSAAPAASTAVVSASATATATASAEPSANVEPTPTAEPSESAAVPSKKYDCGAKGQKPCPMQGWMKKVMAQASSNGEGDKLAEALIYVSKKPPPGYTDWVAMAKEGAAKAKAGDIDGAKGSCKKCHDAYKADYRAKMRDRAW